VSLVRKLRRKGFTLVELLVVVIILAILASIVVGVVPAATARAKKSAFATTLSVLQSAVDRFYAESNAYPTQTQPDATKAQQISMNAQDGLGAQFLGGYLQFEPNSKAVDMGLNAADGQTVYYGVTPTGRVFATQTAPAADGSWDKTTNGAMKVYTQDKVDGSLTLADIMPK